MTMSLLRAEPRRRSDLLFSSAILLLLAAFALAPSACSGGDDDASPDGDADADADSDSDADADGDTDADGDADADTDGDTDADGDADGDGDCEVPLEARGDIEPEGRVMPIYLVASDSDAAHEAAHREVLDRAIAAVQAWYAEAMGPEHGRATFRPEPAVVLRSRFTSAEWTDFGANGFLYDDGTRSAGCGIWYGAWRELVDDGLLEGAGLPDPGAGGTSYVAVTGGGWGGGCGAGGLAAVEEMLLDRVSGRCPNGTYDSCTRVCADPGGLAGTDPWCDEWPHFEEGYECTAVGAFAHEIGHGFGLPHASDRPESTGDSIMDLWWEYGRGVTLSAEDRADLAASIYFAALP